jgi:N-methylhydantoinase A
MTEEQQGRGLRVAIDTGGTFTDCVAMDNGRLRMLKVRSTPANPALAVLQALHEIGVGAGCEVRHGTTVGTNAMLERKGARVAFVTTAGLEDTIAIGRQTRAKLYDWSAKQPECLVEEALRFGVLERVSAEGEVLREPTDGELAELVARVKASGAESIAVSLLFAFLRPETERRVAEALEELELPVSVAHRILPEFREFERASTVVVNAFLAPKMRQYLLELAGQVLARHSGTVQVMQSSGGIVRARLAAEEPVRTVLSGPAGGVMGAWRMAQLAGVERVIGFDMGGTSTDVFLADAASGGPRLTSESVVAGVPVSVPMLDIHTAGAGGGSIARFDAGGLLRVGPESAGSEPGPICFGRGGEQPTVTDANLLLGRLDPAGFMGGAVKLDVELARARMETCRGALGSVEEFAAGVLRVVETNMERAIRVISVERGHDPREFMLVAFGGGGPLHACAVARALRVPRVMIPAMPGALSAVGILLADEVRDFSRTVMLQGDLAELEQQLAKEFGLLEETAAREGALGGAVERSLDLRYRGQGYELNVPHGAGAAEAFHRLHEQRYGFADRGRVLEYVNVRLRWRVKAEAFVPVCEELREGDGAQALMAERPVFFDEWRATRVYARERLRAGDVLCGPALVSEYSSVTVLPPGCLLRVDRFGNLMIDVEVNA